MIRPRIIATLFRKDIVDGLRESRVLISLITPILLALLYNAVFPDVKMLEVKAAYAGPETSAIVQTLKTRAAGDQSVALTLTHVATVDEVRALVRSKDADAAFVLPDGVDDAIAAGRAPTIVLVQPVVPTAASNFVDTSIQAGARALAGQKPPVVIATEGVKTGGSTDQGVMGEMGPRRYFVLATIVMMLGMIAVLAVPIMLTEETEHKTLEALLLVGSYLEVIIAKAFVGFVYVAVSVAVMLGLTRLRPVDMTTFVGGTSLLAIALIGVGLLLGGLFRNAQQVYTWSSVLLIPVIGPAFVVGLPVPEPIEVALRAFPTSQGMRIIANGLAGQAFFSDTWISFIVIGLWALGAYGLLAWQLSRREY